MMMALAGTPDKPTIIMPGGVTLAVENGEDTAKIQSIGSRFAQNEVTLEYAQDMGCKSCASPGGGCQFLGTAGTSQVVAESLGMTLPHAALTPSGTNLWIDTGRRSAIALKNLIDKKLLNKIKPKSIFVLMSRAAIVNFNDLIKRIKKGDILVATDVFPNEPVKKNDPIRKLKNVLFFFRCLHLLVMIFTKKI